LWIERITKTGRGTYHAPRASVEAVDTRSRPFKYEHVDPDMTDYSRANGAWSRGVMMGFLLESGKVYRVSAPMSWSRADMYYCTVRNGSIKRIDAKDVLLWAR